MSLGVTPKFNLTYMDQVSYLDGYHRSGWAYVISLLMELHSDTAETLLDAYVDRTFHWLKPSFLPYTRPWVGIVHHTFDTSFSSFNNVALLKNELFIQSLNDCKGLYVFTDYMAEQWRSALANIGINNVPIQSLVHPTEFVNENWSPDAFVSNPFQHLVQVGAWLRDNYAIYRLNNGQPIINVGESVNLHKAVLKGQNMDFYFKPHNFFRLLRPPKWKSVNVQNEFTVDTITRQVQQNLTLGEAIVSTNGELPYLQPSQPDERVCRDIICRDSSMFLNKYVEGAIDLLKQYDDSVIVIPQLDNTAFDILLSKNIVFLQLEDAAAVNTVVECIVRNTPLVVNKLPAIVEVLGEEYPLYVNNLGDFQRVLTYNNIMAAYNYLTNLDKSKLQGSWFLQSITNGPIYIPLSA